MSGEQLWLAIGAPLLFNGLIFLLILTNMNARFASIESRLTSLDQRIGLLTGAIHDLDNRITRLDEHRR
jgi:hypothetical protein